MRGKQRHHSRSEELAVVDDCLVVGGVPLPRLAQRVGSTPFYAYDRALVTRRVAALRECLPRDLSLHYAIKANPMPALVQHLAGLVDGFDVASGGELRTALDTPMSRANISFAGPGKSRVELTQAIAAEIALNVESEHELQAIAAIGREIGVTPKVCLRINPDFELKSSGMKMAGGAKQFGIDAERAPQLLGALATLPVAFHGLHIFTGSQNLRPEAIIEAQRQTLDLALRFAELGPAPPPTLNIGGGFGIPYFPGEQALDLAPIGENLERLMATARERLPGTEVIIELGRYLVGEAGYYVCRVVDRKVSRGQVFLVTDGGLHHHLAASGNFGQVLRKNYPVVIGNRVVGAEQETASVVGPLCTPLDLLADRMDLARAEVGDLVVVLQSGAYGLTASPTAFLSHPAPLEVLV